MTDFAYSDELYHHGIKGQKWGVRRFQNEDGSLTALGKKRYSIDAPMPKRRIVQKDLRKLDWDRESSMFDASWRLTQSGPLLRQKQAFAKSEKEKKKIEKQINKNQQKIINNIDKFMATSQFMNSIMAKASLLGDYSIERNRYGKIFVNKCLSEKGSTIPFVSYDMSDSPWNKKNK